MSPEPTFLRFFATEFPDRLKNAEIPGMADASWDRRAAWLLWTAERRDSSPAASEVALDKPETDIFQ